MSGNPSDVVSMDIRCKGGLGIFNLPYILSFCRHPVFALLPCYSVDDRIVPDIKSLHSISISDRSMSYFVGAMDNHSKENCLFYLGKTTLLSWRNSIVFDRSLFPAEFTDVVFIPEKIFYELTTSLNYNIFKIQKYNEFSDDVVTHYYSKENSVFVYNLKEEDITKENFPEKLYLNPPRWEFFFSPVFQDLTNMFFSGIPHRDTNFVEYDHAYAKGESIQFTLPYYRTVKDEQCRFLCKYIHEILFKKKTDGSSEESRIYPSKIIAMIYGYGWIHILHDIEI